MWVTPHLATVTYVEVEDADGAAPTVVFEGLTPRSRPDAEDARRRERVRTRDGDVSQGMGAFYV